MTDHSAEQSTTMTVEETVPPVPPESADPASPRPSRRRAGLWVGAGFGLVVAAGGAGGAWLWQQQRELAARVVVRPEPIVPVDPNRVTRLENQIADLTAHLKAQVQLPAPAAVDLGPTQARLDQLAARLDAGLSADGAAGQATDARIQALDARLAAAEQGEKEALARADRALALVRAAQALAAGRPLGALAGAPAALTRFASAAPPTEAALRLAFPALATAAAQASRPAAGQSFGQRVLQRVEGLVTIRQGDAVLIGAPAAPILEEIRTHLDAGDLAGALAVLDRLDPAAAAVLAPWRAQAQALLDARAALALLAQS